MPGYVAGWVNAGASVKWGSGFTVSRVQVAGSYRITIPPGTPARFFAPAVTPSTLHTIARIAQIQRDAFSGVFMIDVEIRDMTTNALMDGDFTFVAIERSGP
jgi:hypothetical protein